MTSQVCVDFNKCSIMFEFNIASFCLFTRYGLCIILNIVPIAEFSSCAAE